MATANRANVKYVYDLPYFERKELCRILDHNDKWEELGGKYMNFDFMTIQFLRSSLVRGKSPTDELLTMWGHQNHTVLELFVLLSKMQHYQSMLTLKPFVDPQYHRLIYEGEENLARIFRSPPTPAFSHQPCLQSPILKNEPTNICPPQNIGQLVVGPQSPSPHPLTFHMPPQHPHSLAKSMELGLHNLNSPDRPQSPAKLTHPTKPPPADNQQEKKILNTERVLAVGQPPSNEENANVASAMPQGQSAGIRGPPEEKEINIPTPEPPRAATQGKSDAAEASTVAESYGSIPHISYKELLVATNGWDKATILGKGGFGTVFKGTWKNTLVAIKRIELRGGETPSSHEAQMEQSLREMKFLNSYRHDNILPLYGYSLDGDEPCLLYQFMPNGSLEDRLLCRHGTSPLSWLQRHNIARGSARGLQFLHTIKEKPLIHGDIKSANILLDQNFEARIGDFGLAREGPNNQYTHIKVSRVHGTRPYLPDEFLRSKRISSKVDTYSFGIVLFELATGLRAYDDGRSRKFLKDYVESFEEEGSEMALIDRRLDASNVEWVGSEGGAAVCPNPDHNVGSSIFVDLLRLGKLCVKRRPGERPEMVLVLQELDGMAARREIATRAQKLLRLNSITPSNPYERQFLHDQWLRKSPQPPVSHPRVSSPMGHSPNLVMPQPSHPASTTSTASTVPSPYMFAHNPPRYMNNPPGAIAKFMAWHNPNNNPMVLPNVLLPPRGPSLIVQPPSPIPHDDNYPHHPMGNNGYDGSRGSPSHGFRSSMSVPYSDELLPATIPGQGGDSLTGVLEDQASGINQQATGGICDGTTVLESQLLPRISLLGIGGRNDTVSDVADATVLSGPTPREEMPTSEISVERSPPKQQQTLTPKDKTNPIFPDD